MSQWKCSGFALPLGGMEPALPAIPCVHVRNVGLRCRITASVERREPRRLPLLPIDQLSDFVTAIFAAAGVSTDVARAVAESLADANACGCDSHGVARVPEYLEQLRRGDLEAGAALRVEQETPALLAGDAGFGFGQLMMRRLHERLAPKARTLGVACGALRNCGHIGRLGEHTERAALDGLAALLMVNDNGVLRSVAPPGGLTAQVSTNPISIAVPAPQELGGGAVVLDISTSVVAQGKVMLRRQANQPCPEGWLQDAQGEPTTDPFVLLAEPPGAMLPLGGQAAHKGFGLALLVDMLTAGLSGGFCPPPLAGARLCNSVLMVLLDPDRFASRAHLLEQVARLAESIHACPTRTGYDALRLPGERSAALRRERQTLGIPVVAATWQRLVRAATTLGVAIPPVPEDS